MTHAESHISAEDVVVGQGAYGTVYKAKRPSLRAIKVIPYTHTIPAEAIREIATLKRLDGCDGCVRLLDIWIGSNTIELNLELCPNGSLQERLDAGASASFPKRLLWAGQLLDGLIGVHDKNMVHRDVKPENILLTATDDIKLVDFGLSRNGPDGAPLTPRVCTIYYRPPELLAHYLSHGGDGRAAMVYGPEVDCWSAGCVLRELLTGRGPEFRPTDVAVDPLVSSAQQLEAIITRFGFEFSVFDSDEVAAFCASDAVLPDVSTPSILEGAAREISLSLLVPNPLRRATCRQAREELLQVEILERLESCWLQASSYDFGMLLLPRGFCVTRVGPPAANRAEKTEMTRLLKRITPSMARLLDGLTMKDSTQSSATSSPEAGGRAPGACMAKARQRMAELWPHLREMHVRATGVWEPVAPAA